MVAVEGAMSLNTKSLQDYRQHLNEVMTIQGETVRRLVADDSTPPLEMAAVLEDIANLFLDISDDIRDLALGQPQDSPQSVQDNRAAADPV